jgi:hypothetical protein
VIPAAEVFQFLARDADFDLIHEGNYSKIRSSNGLIFRAIASKLG